MDGLLAPLIRSQSRSIYVKLRGQIIRGELLPHHKLKISALALELGSNSSAVREALSRLTAEQLVEARDQQGFRVASVSLAELDDLTENRIEIEVRALLRSMRNGDSEWEDRVRRARQDLAFHEVREPCALGAAAHDAFHDALIGACDSPALMRIRRSLYDLTERYRWIAIGYAGRRRYVEDEHDALDAAALARDETAAAAAMADHIQRTADLVREAIIAQSQSTA